MPILSKEEEEKLVNHLMQEARCGYGVTKKTVRNIASEIFRASNKAKGQHEGRVLTNGWLQGFMTRWPSLKVRKPQKLSMYRAAATSETTVKKYFEELKTTLLTYNLTDRPDLIFNVDETGFLGEHPPQQEPKGAMVPCL
ncbi:hypothetical protein HOLleu_05927 [Holothuria leucospilota]|uniref:HTH CENPB-type domain-containing protein n=1 Tax=Holothuria leucospilota TaxID=206669 RepID=A0A9Q1CKR4_HOLLE|nr:hypothetical protein HOLleu_05927 [Holothuria leucospilota]